MSKGDEGRGWGRVYCLVFGGILLATIALLVYVAITRPAGPKVTPPQAAPAKATPEDLVERLRAAAIEGPDAEEEREALIVSLQEQGEAAIPAVSAGLDRRIEPLTHGLTWVLAGIPGDASTSLLMRVVGEESAPRLVGAAVTALENRPVRRPLTKGELRALTQRVREGNVIGAGRVARVLGNCVMVPPAQRLAPILARFEREVVSPSPVGDLIGNYVSPRVAVLNQFVLGISYIGEPAIAPLRQAVRRAAGKKELEKWLVLTLGMAGDSAVAARLKSMALGEPDRYVRCVAVRAYARSAKQDAIPVLESLLDDPTESEYESCMGDRVRLISGAAQGELSRLRREGGQEGE